MTSGNGRKWAWVYAFIGAINALAAVYHIVAAGPRSTYFHVFLYAVISFTASGIILSVAHRHYKNPLPNRRYGRLNTWFIAGGVFSTAVAVVTLYIGSDMVTQVELIETSQLLLGIGLAAGFLIGTFEAESLENADAAARADTLEEERERLKVVNDLLRHYVLNGASIIGGYAGRLESAKAGEQSESATVIKERADEMATIVDNIGVLTTIEWGDSKKVAADIGAAIREGFTASMARAKRCTCLTISRGWLRMRGTRRP